MAGGSFPPWTQLPDPPLDPLDAPLDLNTPLHQVNLVENAAQLSLSHVNTAREQRRHCRRVALSRVAVATSAPQWNKRRQAWVTLGASRVA